MQLCLSLERGARVDTASSTSVGLEKWRLVFLLRNMLGKRYIISVWEPLDVINHKYLNEKPYLESPDINNNAGSPVRWDI